MVRERTADGRLNRDLNETARQNYGRSVCSIEKRRRVTLGVIARVVTIIERFIIAKLTIRRSSSSSRDKNGDERIRRRLRVSQ